MLSDIKKTILYSSKNFNKDHINNQRLVTISKGWNAFKLYNINLFGLINALPNNELGKIISGEESYNVIFNLYNKKLFFIFGFPFEISLSNLYLQIENFLYTFSHFYSLNTYTAQYFKIFIMFVLIFLISNLLFGVAYFFSLNTIKDSEKLSQYECGFEPFDEATRHPFDVHFYVVGILFLIFDVEIALLFPWIYTLHLINWFGFYMMMLFLIILTIGFFYEWHRGALAWPHSKILSKKKN